MLHDCAEQPPTVGASTSVTSSRDCGKATIVMRKILILGRGGAGKSTAALALRDLVGLPVIELDEHFWCAGSTPMSRAEWVGRQSELVAGDDWIIDGDLGPHDELFARVPAADTIIVLDFALVRCAWRAARRSRENVDFWWWLICWRLRSRPLVLGAVNRHAPTARVHVVRNPRSLKRFLASVGVDRGGHLRG